MHDVVRHLPPPRGSFFLLGPRGTGKSTWARAAFPGAPVVDLLEEERYQAYLADPKRFADELRALPRGAWIVVDEIQRLPSLLNEVHRAIEGRRQKFVLTGSSARKLRRGGTNLLGGRARELAMFPFLPTELGARFTLDSALETGTLPLVWASEEPEATLGAYVQTYLKEEIQAEALVRNLPGFARFLPIAGLFHGQVINVAGVARDAGVSRTTVDGFVEILEDTLIATRLPAFESRLRVRERRHPKLYFFDPGVARALCRRRGAIVGAEGGALFEGFVYGMLRAIQSYDDVFDAVAYWSPAEARDTEVDFVVSRGRERIAIEAKAGRALHDRDFRGLRAIADLPGLSRRVVVYGGNAVLRTQDGIDIWPVTTFAEALRDGQL